MFARFPFHPIPTAFNDRFEPNDAASAAPDLGKVVQRLLPNLALATGDEDWFHLEAAATGTLTIAARSHANVSLPANTIQLQLWDESGTQMLMTGSDLPEAVGNVLGQDVRYPSTADQHFLVRVLRSDSASGDPVRYALDLLSLTEDLGTSASANTRGTLAEGGQALYRLTAAATGSLRTQLRNGANVQGNLNLQVLDPQTFAVLSTTPAPRAVTASEPNDAIGQANDTGLVDPGAVQFAGVIGDGAFGMTTGDHDYYRLEAGASQRIDVALDLQGSGLDGVILVYDSAGRLLSGKDDNGPGVGESLSFVTTQADTYFVAVYGFGAGNNGVPPEDPLVPGTGSGVGSSGAYTLTLTMQAVGPGAVNQSSVPVRRGESVLLMVTGEGASAGDFEVTIDNLDQFSTPENTTLFFPTTIGPSAAALADFNRDGNLDVAVTHIGEDVLSVFLGNGDGTFHAPRQFTVGAFALSTRPPQPGLPTFGRAVDVAHFNGDAFLDVAVVNHDSADVSVLLGRGDGTFAPQRRSDATGAPFGLDAADVNADGFPDLVVADSVPDSTPTLGSVLLGRGDGSFQVQRSFPLPSTDEPIPPNDLILADFNHDGKLDLVHREIQTRLYLGNGDGTFQPGSDILVSVGPGFAVADVDGDGNLDVITTAFNTNRILYALGNGNGTFGATQIALTGQYPVALDVADFGSAVILPDGSTTLGPPDGHPDLIVVDNGLSGAALNGPPEVQFLPGLVDAQDGFAGFGDPIHLASVEGPLNVKAGDLNRDGAVDIVVVDRDGFLVIFGKQPVIPPNDSPQTARDLGTVVHLVRPTLTIVPGHADAFFTLTVPTEVAAGAGDQVLDFSALFEALDDTGLGFEVHDAAGNLLGAGERFRVRAPQGSELLLHVFGLPGLDGRRGAGAYTLNVTVLPQVVSVQAQHLLPGIGAAPGGPTASLVVTLQGDRLDPATAADPANYRVIWLGPDGLPNTADDEILPLAADGQAVVYDPSTNVEIASGLAYPVAIRQTVTLLFDRPLPPGAYAVELSAAIQVAAFNAEEASLLAGGTSHSVVSLINGQIVDGSLHVQPSLVAAPGALGDFGIWQDGTPFLTQLHDNLGALLDAALTELSDDPSIPITVDQQILDRFLPALGGPDERPTGMLILWLDPVSFDLADAEGSRVRYSLTEGSFRNDLLNAFVSVAGNVEVLVIPTLGGRFVLNVSDVPERARGGAVLLGLDNRAVPLTTDLRAGIQQFEFVVPFQARSPVTAGVTGQGGGTDTVAAAPPTAAVFLNPPGPGNVGVIQGANPGTTDATPGVGTASATNPVAISVTGGTSGAAGAVAAPAGVSANPFPNLGPALVSLLTTSVSPGVLPVSPSSATAAAANSASLPGEGGAAAAANRPSATSGSGTAEAESSPGSHPVGRAISAIIRAISGEVARLGRAVADQGARLLPRPAAVWHAVMKALGWNNGGRRERTVEPANGNASSATPASENGLAGEEPARHTGPWLAACLLVAASWGDARVRRPRRRSRF